MTQQATRAISLPAARGYYVRPVSHPHLLRKLLSVVWAAVPLATIGWFTWAAFAFAALRTRRRDDVESALAYFICFVASVGVAVGTHSSVWMYAPLAIPWLVGTMHAVHVRDRVFALD